MRIRRFQAADHASALAMVKETLGAEAVILSSRTVTTGVGRRRVEVVAALDRDLQALTADASAAGGEDVSSATAPAPASRPGEARTAARAEQPARPLRFRRELAAGLDRRGPARPATPPIQEVAPGRPSPAAVARWRDQLIDSLVCRPPALDRRRILALVGATGVGKTTTAAKLAAWALLRQRKRVALVSMDCYRIGATDQLRTYARIMGIPCEVALRPPELSRALERHRTADLVIIDTAGKSPYDSEHVGELARWFAASDLIEPLLTVAATTKKEDLAVTFDAYRPLEVEGVVVAKLDETRAYASLCQQLASAGIPLSCLAIGQRVPEDFLLASRQTVGKLFRDGWDGLVTWLGRGATAAAPWQ